MKEKSMNNKKKAKSEITVPSLPEFEGEIIWDEHGSRILSKMLRDSRKNKKTPTSVALDPQTIQSLKELAEKKGIPYQVLMRSFILEGLDKAKKE